MVQTTAIVIDRHASTTTSLFAHDGVQFDGASLIFGIAAIVVGGLAGYAVARRQVRYWRTVGFRHLVTLSQMFGHFTIGDVMVAFDPTCADERRRLSELWRRSKDDPDDVAAVLPPHPDPDVDPVDVA